MGIGVKIEPIITVQNCMVDFMGGGVGYSGQNRSWNPCVRHDAKKEELEMKLLVDN